MDRTKYLEPKFSDSLEPLSKFIKDKCDSETMSTMTSQFSMFKNSAGGTSELTSLIALAGNPNSSVMVNNQNTPLNVSSKAQLIEK